jgi:hypothetical protein
MHPQTEIMSRIGALELNAATAALQDGALEAATVANPHMPTGIAGHPMCRHIEDAELEHAADGVFAGPKTIIFPGSHTRCV